jgi:hypothetical protein
MVKPEVHGFELLDQHGDGVHAGASLAASTELTLVRLSIDG